GERRQVRVGLARRDPRLRVLERSAEGAAREALRPRVPRDVAARVGQADQRDREGDGPLALDREHLPHAHPAQAGPYQQRGAGALRGAPPARRVSTVADSVNSAVDAVAGLRPHAGVEAQTSAANILLVDDEPKSLYALQELLSTLGENLLTAASGEEALRLALKNDFAVTLLDMRMPGIDGLETARLILNLARSTLSPITYLTTS